MAERLQDFVTFCSPDEEMGDKLEFTSGHIQVYNGKHPLYTELVIRGEPQGRQGGWAGWEGAEPGLLLALWM